MTTKYKVGDTVLWRGGFGRSLPREAKIEGIEKCEPGQKYGYSVEVIETWEHGVVDLDNGHWAYVHQLSPKEGGR